MVISKIAEAHLVIDLVISHKSTECGEHAQQEAAHWAVIVGSIAFGKANHGEGYAEALRHKVWQEAGGDNETV